MLRQVILAILLVWSSFLYGQVIEPLGQAPPRLKWQQIETPHFRVIFPKGMETYAQRTANALDNAYRDVARSLGVLPKKIPVIMQNQTTDNNAFVSSEPRRAEFFSTPPQNPANMGMNNWFDELSLHEYRHIVQQEQSKQGWGKYIFYLFGNSGTSIMQGLTNPWWFWEGDAVGCESTMGYGGRGRIPSFDLTFRTQLLTRGAFPYVKASCGSFKNAIPNHYLLGYLMTTYVKNHHGADTWDSIMARTYTKPPFPFSFSRSMKKITGLNANETYGAMTKELKGLWSGQADSIKETVATFFNHPGAKAFVNYKFPQYLPDGDIVVQKAGLETGSFLAYKSSIVDQSQFVLLTKEGKEKRVRISGVLDDNGLMSSAGNKIVWTEFSYDPRWGARNYTVIKILDVKTNTQKQITHRSRLHAPCLSPDGRSVAAIEYTTGCKFYLVLLDASTGRLIKRFDNPDNKQYLQPHITRDGRSIILIHAWPGYKSILRIDIETGRITTVMKPVPENISAPIDYRNFILFNSPQSGIDNIYAMDTATGEEYRVTNRRYGAFNPCISPDNTTLTFQDFTPDGFRIATMPIEAGKWEKINPQQEHSDKVEYYKPFAQQEAGNILSHIPDSVYPSTPYKRLANAIHVYSWGVEPLSNLPQPVSLGIKSQDLLSTTVLEAGYRYNNNEKHWGKYCKLSYEAFYPKFFLAYSDGKRKTIFTKGETDSSAIAGLHYQLISFRNVNFGSTLPLNFSGGPFIRKLNLAAQLVYTEFDELNRRIDSKKSNRTFFGNFYSLQYDASFEMRLRQNLRDVAPRFGSLIEFTSRHTAFNSFFRATQAALNVNIFIPGFFPHHSIRLRANWQQDDSSNYHFENRFDFTRGQKDQLFNRWQLWSVDYKMPLCYPDFSVLNGFLYFQRLKADMFTELGIGKSAYNNAFDGHLRRYNTIGVELTADVNFMRFLLPFDAGIRSTYSIQSHAVHDDLILKVPIF